MPFGIVDDGFLLPPHRVVLDGGPQRRHIIVVRMVGMARLSGGVQGERIVQVAQIHDLALGGQPVHLEGVAHAPASGVDDALAAAGDEGSAVEERLDGADARLSQRLVAEGGGVQFAPFPLADVFAEFIGTQLAVNCFGEGSGKHIVARFDFVGGGFVVPPGAVGLLDEVAHHHVPARAAVRPVACGQVIHEGVVNRFHQKASKRTAEAKSAVSW